MKILGILIILSALVGCGIKKSESEQIQTTITDTLTVKTILLRVDGMTCEGCENTIKNVVGKIEGVKEVQASYTNSQTTVVFDTSLASIVTISEAINELGYKVAGEITP